MINQWCITSKFRLVWLQIEKEFKLWDLNLFWCIDSWIWPIIIIIWNLCIVSSICDFKQSIPARASFSFGSAVQLAYSVILKFFVLVFFLWNIIFFLRVERSLSSVVMTTCYSYHAWNTSEVTRVFMKSLKHEMRHTDLDEFWIGTNSAYF